MNSIITYFEQAQLALAAYSNFTPGMTLNDFKLALQDGDKAMSPAQASAFAAKWSVVTQYTDSGTGLSATVFQEIATGKRYLAIRGTEPSDFLRDIIINDGLIAVGYIPDSLPQYRALKDRVAAWLGDGTLPSSFTVSGHSLGGYLATALTADFSSNITQAYLYNAPGLNGVLGSATAAILDAFGITAPVDSSRIYNLKADAGISPIAGLGAQVAPPISIAIENQFLSDAVNPPLSYNHSQRVLTDALALYAAYAQVDPTASVTSITNILKASSNLNGNTLEAALDNLRELLLGATVPGTVPEGRESYYTNLYQLADWLTARSAPGTAPVLKLDALTSYSGGQIVALAQADTPEGLAYRYAVANLVPFAITGEPQIFASHNANGELDLYDPATGQGSLTDLYLKDRAAMLSWKMKYDIGAEDDNDQLIHGDRAGKPYSEQWDTSSVSGDWNFVDLATQDNGSPLSLFIDGKGDSIFTADPDHQIVFGSSKADTLTGQETTDHLFGGVGDDTLTGDKGNDHLEGGQGLDTYLINAGDGVDIVLDSDGTGVIQIAGIQAKGSAGLDPKKWVKLNNDSFTDIQNNLTYSKSIVEGETRLLIKKGDATVLVKGWDDGELGIALGEGAAPDLPATPGPILGDKKPLDTKPDESGVQEGYDALHNLLVEDIVEGRQDILYGSAGNDHIKGLSGIDYLAGKHGDDLLEGGTEADALAGGLGDDTLKGEDGNDILLGDRDLGVVDSYDYTRYGSLIANQWVTTEGGADGGVMLHHWQISIGSNETAGGADIMEGGLGDDYAFAGGGDDRLDGGDGADVLFGDAGNDVLSGNAGADVLTGDSLHPDLPGALHGDDTLSGGDANDKLWGAGGNDVLDGGIGDDMLIGDGERVPEEYEGGDLLIGGEGNDKLRGRGGEDLLLGGEGADDLYGEAGDDILDGGAGEDYLAGGAGNDTYLDVTGEDTVLDERGDNTILLATATGLGEAGLNATAETNGTGHPVAQLQISLDTGETLRLDNPFWNRRTTLQFVSGEVCDLETLVAEKLAVPLNLISANTGGRVYGGAGVDTLTGGAGPDTMCGHGGSDRLLGHAGDDALEGGEGDDALDGGAGTDTLVGGAGNDSLSGMGDDDTLDGGRGSDHLAGGEGRDAYRFNLGDGEDVIEDDARSSVSFGTGIDLSDLRVSRNAYGYRIAYGAQGDAINVPLEWAGGLGRLRFADGTYVLSNELLVAPKRLEVRGSAGNDVLVETRPAAMFVGGKGDDVLVGGVGDNTYVFNLGDGSDALKDLGGEDTIRFGAGITPEQVHFEYNGAAEGVPAFSITIGDTGDRIAIVDGEKGVIERFVFRNGKVMSFAELAVAQGLPPPVASATQGMYLYQESSLVVGTAGDDQIEDGDVGDVVYFPGRGDDVLQVYMGRNYFYLLNEGDGHDTLDNEEGSERETLIFGEGVTPESLAFEVSLTERGNYNPWTEQTESYTSRDLTIHYGSSGDTLHIPDGAGSAPIERLLFADGQERWLGPGGILSEGRHSLDDFANGYRDGIVVGTYFAPLFDIPALAHARTTVNWVGTEADDSYTARNLLAVNGEARLPQADVAWGGTGNDMISTLAGNDVLLGGLGQDTLLGGSGSDRYEFASGDGQDTIADSAKSGERNYILIQGESTALPQFGFDGKDLSIRHGDNLQDEICVKGFFAGGSDETAAISGLWFSFVQSGSPNEGEYYALADIKAAVGIQTGESGNDLMQGGEGLDFLYGGAGDDTYVVTDAGDRVFERAGEGFDQVHSNVTYRLPSHVEALQLTGSEAVNAFGNPLDNLLQGNDANNVLNGAAGADTMQGGMGNDTYYVDQVGDVVVEHDGQGIDMVRSSISFDLPEHMENLSLTGSATLVGRGNGLDNRLHGNGSADYLLGAAGADTLRGHGGDDVLQGDGDADRLYGGLGANLLDGGEGDDLLTGGSGHELFIGGKGDDTINTGTGADVIVFNRGDGHDTVNGSRATDNTLTLGGVAATQLSLAASGYDLLLDVAENDRITFRNWYRGNRSIATLQMVGDDNAASASDGTDALGGEAVASFDFAGLVAAFDAARAADPGLSSWALAQALADFHVSGSDAEAVGGDLVFQYHRLGSITGIGLAAAQAVVFDPVFGAAPQPLRHTAELHAGTVLLA